MLASSAGILLPCMCVKHVCDTISSGNHSDDDSETEKSDDVAPEGDKQIVLAIGAKELKVMEKQHMLSDITARQLAYAIADSYEFVYTTDMLDVGGETAACLHEQPHSFPRARL